MLVSVSNKQARQFLLKKQLLYPPQSLKGKNAVDTVFNNLRVIQYDPLNPCGRNTDLVLQSRIKDYHPDGYYPWLYKGRKGIECYDKEMCIVPIADFPLTHQRISKATRHPSIKNIFTKYIKEIDHLLLTIKKNGPISSLDITNEIRVASDWYGDERFSRYALESLWKTGKLVISHRKNGKKYYDLPTKVYGESLHENIDGTLTKNHILRRINSVGLLPKSTGSDGWRGIGKAKEVSQLLQELINEEKVLEVSVENAKYSYVALMSDKELLTSIVTPIKKKMVFIAPLDNLIWDRKMIFDIFQFFYRWEVYVPASKRKWGYYMLPIVYRDTFVGRVEPVFNKKDKTLEIRSLIKEDGVNWNREMDKAYVKALEQFKYYLQAKSFM